jgi:hypothetical protein
LNTGDRWYGDYSSQSSQVDTRMTALCTAIKSGGVTIYTPQIDTDGVGQSAVLPACASNANDFFMLTQPSQIAHRILADRHRDREVARHEVNLRNVSIRKKPGGEPGF